MTRHDTAPDPDADPAVSRFALAWLAALGDTSYAPLEPADKVRLFRELTDQIVDAIADPDPDSAVLAAERIGWAMVTVGYSEPATLARTVTILNDQLLSTLAGISPVSVTPTSVDPTSADPASADPAGVARLRILVASLVNGHCRAQHDRTLDEQENVRLAALRARFDAERELREFEARQRYASLHDGLTGLPNRTALAAELDQALRPAQPRSARIGLIVVGLDRFEAINDSLGHAVGDQVLIVAAERLRAMANETGHRLARLDADQFALLLRDTTCPDDAVKVADRALSVLAARAHIDGQELPIAASAGVVEQAIGGADTAELLRAADITLHWAKADGRGRWRLFDPQRNAYDIARYQLSAALPAALRRDEFFLEFQPLVRLPDQMLVGVEALARWKHPTQGLLPPDRFIGLAEDTGMIVPLGLRLLEWACEEGVGWHAVGPHPPLVSVNLSVRQVRSPSLVADVLAVLDRIGLPPEKLQLEITEGAVLGTDDDTVRSLRSLADRGVLLALDDFGTGYANLAYLRSLPIRELKLASTFARGVAEGIDSDEAIVAGLVSLAHRLGLGVTAEGVECEQAAQWLADIGCDRAQGWHFGRPISAQGITDLLMDARG